MPWSTLSGDLSAYFRADRSDEGDRYLPVLVIVGAVLSVAALAGITWMARAARVWHAVLHGDWLFLLLAPVAFAIGHVGYTIAYRPVATAGFGDLDADHAARLGHKETFAIVTVGFGPISPRGGYALDTDELQKRGMSEDQAERRVRVLGLLEYAVLAPAALVAAIYLTVEGAKAQSGLLPSWVIGVPGGAAVALGLLWRYRAAGRPATWWGPLRHFLQSIDDLWQLLRAWPAGAVAFGGMILYWAGEIAALTACLDAFAHRRGAIALMVVGYATGYALTRRALPLGGAGVVEALLPFALNWIGFPLAQAVVSVIAYRIITLWLALVPAYLALRRLDAGDRSPTAPPAGRAPRPVTGST